MLVDALSYSGILYRMPELECHTSPTRCVCCLSATRSVVRCGPQLRKRFVCLTLVLSEDPFVYRILIGTIVDEARRGKN